MWDLNPGIVLLACLAAVFLLFRYLSRKKAEEPSGKTQDVPGIRAAGAGDAASRVNVEPAAEAPDKPVLKLTPNQKYVWEHSKKLAKLRLLCKQVDSKIQSQGLALPLEVELDWDKYHSWDVPEACADARLDACMILLNTCGSLDAEVRSVEQAQVSILNDGSLRASDEVLSESGLTAKEFSDCEWEIAWTVRPRTEFSRVVLARRGRGASYVSLAQLDGAVKTVLVRRYSNIVRTLSEFYQQAKISLDGSVSTFRHLEDKKTSARAFRSWTMEGFLKAYLKDHHGEVQAWLDAIDRNRSVIRGLESVYDMASGSGDDRAYAMINSRLAMTASEYYGIVDRLCRGMKLEEPKPGAWCVKYSYTSPQGRNHEEKLCRIFEKDMREFMSLYQEKKKQLTFAEQQRRLMTPKLRYQVLREDGFRCVICGRGQEDGVKLEVDHIVPVSKGGRTVRSNLRTLCWDCNQGKHDEYNPGEIN